MNPISRTISLGLVLLALAVGQQSSWLVQATDLGGILNSVGQVGNNLLGGGRNNVLEQATNIVSKPLNGLLDLAGSNNQLLGSYPMAPLELGSNLMTGINTGAQTVLKSVLEPVSSALHLTPQEHGANTASYGGYGASINPAIQAASQPSHAAAASSANNVIQRQMAANAMANAMNYGPAERAIRAARSAELNDPSLLSGAYGPAERAVGSGAAQALLANDALNQNRLGAASLNPTSVLDSAAANTQHLANQAQLARTTGALSASSSPVEHVAPASALGAVPAVQQAVLSPPVGPIVNPLPAVASRVDAANRQAALAGAASAAAGPVGAADTLGAASATENALALGAASPGQIEGRRALAQDAYVNAQAEAAIAGADMIDHGLNNARSASLASNAYRQAKLAAARDRVNIAGTIQNTARMSDAAIATHDTSLNAENSLTGSELAVDSVATVLDSDGAHIPPVTNSMLRSLPYGRLGLRNILPRPLTYPSVLLPDVWLNGSPVSYINTPLRIPPYGIPGMVPTYANLLAGSTLAPGQIFNGQPLYSNNGILLNSLAFDPTTAYLARGRYGLTGSSVYPVLANGRVQALDEVAMADASNKNLRLANGPLGTYFGYGLLNNVPMLTGSVSNINISPISTIGSTYPIGSALVIEPRDSYFQDYIDSASSRQNFDERQQ